MDWLLYDRDLRQERVNPFRNLNFTFNFNAFPYSPEFRAEYLKTLN